MNGLIAVLLLGVISMGEPEWDVVYLHSGEVICGIAEADTGRGVISVRRYDGSVSVIEHFKVERVEREVVPEHLRAGFHPQIMQIKQMGYKDPGTAIALSILIPGGGYFYVGGPKNLRSGIVRVFISIYAIFKIIEFKDDPQAQYIWGVVGGFSYVSGIVGSPWAAERHNERYRK